MIDPRAVTNFNRTRNELEEFLLFAIVVAGKNAFQQAEKLDRFLTLPEFTDLKPGSPFVKIRLWDSFGKLGERLREVKMGQYERITTAFRGVANFFRGEFDLSDFTRVDQLECVKGIGMKTARFFMMHTRPNQQFACLDTHILKWLGEKGHEVPRTTPRGEKYLLLEKVFLDYCRDMNILPADLDLQIWNERHQNAKAN